MKKNVQMAISACLGLFLLWLLFRNTDWKVVGATIRGVNIGWLLLSQVFAWGSYFARSQRWSYVVRAAHPATYRSLFSATQIGFLTNFTVPLRVGEVVRAYVLSRLSKLPFSQSIAMVGLDRVNDLLALLAVLIVALVSFPSDRNVEIPAGVFNNAEPFVVSSALLRPAATALTIIVLGISLVLVLLYANQDLVLRAIARFRQRVYKRLGAQLYGLFQNFAAGMHVFRSPADLTKSLLLSLLVWCASLLSIATVLTAFAIDFPWHAPFFVLAMIAISISVPLTPGLVGQYHIVVIAALMLAVPGIEPTKAKAVVVVAHILMLIPVGALGAYSLLRERLSFFDLTRHGVESRVR